MGCLVGAQVSSRTGKLGSGAFERKEVRCNAQQKPESSWLSSGGVTLPGKNSSKVESEFLGSWCQDSGQLWQLLFHAHFPFWCHT